MPLALLLSPDDQAVSAITAVLEEMSVTCERPLDGGSAAKQLSSQSFDLVLVDCENLPAAKLIFDVCRRGKSGHSPVPIAIVDGRAGLPTAFRLGAELILTKPVAMDQARTTIRNAVGRMKKEEPRSVQPVATGSPESVAVQPVSTSDAKASSDPTTALLTQYEVPSEPAGNTEAAPKAVAAAAAAGSSPLPSPSQFSAVASSPAISPEISPRSTPPKAKVPVPIPAFEEAPAASITSAPKKSDAPAAPAQPKSASVEKLSDDPVLAGLEKGETPPPAPIFSSYQPKRRKTRGPFVALLVLALAGGGLYAAWMYVPGFRAAVQPQLDAALAFADNLLQSHSFSPATKSVQPATQPSRPQAAAAGSSQPSQPADTSTPPTSVGTPASATASGNPGSATAASAGSAQPDAQPAPAGSATTPSNAAKPGAQGSGTKVATQTIDFAAGTTSASTTSDELPWEKTAIILSSKGAEKRLAHFVRPTFPAGARSTGAEGTVVLKALIDEDGKVAGTRVVEGNAMLANAAIRAVKQWRYRPYIRDGRALPFQTVVLVDFQRP